MRALQLILLSLLLLSSYLLAEYTPPATLVTIADLLKPRATIVPPSSQQFEIPKENNGFWLTTDLLVAEFRKGCLTTALCHEPKFKLINTMKINGEQSVMSWPANSGGDLVQVLFYYFFILPHFLFFYNLKKGFNFLIML